MLLTVKLNPIFKFASSLASSKSLGNIVYLTNSLNPKLQLFNCKKVKDANAAPN